MRVVVPALREAGVVVGGLQAAGVQVQRVLEEGGAGVPQVRAARPPPARHGAQRRRRHHVAQRQWLLQQGSYLLLQDNRPIVDVINEIIRDGPKFVLHSV